MVTIVTVFSVLFAFQFWLASFVYWIKPPQTLVEELLHPRLNKLQTILGILGHVWLVLYTLKCIEIGRIIQ